MVCVRAIPSVRLTPTTRIRCDAIHSPSHFRHKFSTSKIFYAIQSFALACASAQVFTHIRHRPPQHWVDTQRRCVLCCAPPPPPPPPPRFICRSFSPLLRRHVILQMIDTCIHDRNGSKICTPLCDWRWRLAISYMIAHQNDKIEY